MYPTTDATIPPYDPTANRDRRALWGLKRGFETGIGETTGGADNSSRYESKLTERYRRRWLEWVDRCVDDEPRCLSLGETDGGVAGYVFLLPGRLSFVWDAAVVHDRAGGRQHQIRRDDERADDRTRDRVGDAAGPTATPTATRSAVGTMYKSGANPSPPTNSTVLSPPSRFPDTSPSRESSMRARTTSAVSA